MAQVEDTIKDPDTAKEIKEATQKATEKATEKATQKTTKKPIQTEVETETLNKLAKEVEKEVEKEEADIEEAKPEVEIDYLDRLQRTLAEFDNYRKRTDKEKSAMYDLGLSDTVSAILPVIDNFERALDSSCEDESYVDGMKLIYKQMLELLCSIGITQIKARGQKFDTNLHDAVMHIEDDKYEENQIVAELQKGYIYKDEKVIRYSMVQVAN